MLKHFRDLSFTQQLTFPIALMGFVVLGGVTTFTAQNSFKEAKRAATTSSLETGKRSSQQIKAQIDHAQLSEILKISKIAYARSRS